jgi:hypothetical protein
MALAVLVAVVWGANVVVIDLATRLARARA